MSHTALQPAPFPTMRLCPVHANHGDCSTALYAPHVVPCHVHANRRGDLLLPWHSGQCWSEEEHWRFLAGLEKFGKGDWRNIARQCVFTRTPTQVASHAQKFFLRQSQASPAAPVDDPFAVPRVSIHDITTNAVREMMHDEPEAGAKKDKGARKGTGKRKEAAGKAGNSKDGHDAQSNKRLKRKEASDTSISRTSSSGSRSSKTCKAPKAAPQASPVQEQSHLRQKKDVGASRDFQRSMLRRLAFG